MSTSEATERIQEIRKNLEINETEYLLKIWKTNLQDEWTSEAIEAIREILLSRLGTVPDQNEPTIQRVFNPQNRKLKLSLTRFNGRFEIPNLNSEEAHQLIEKLHQAFSSQKPTNIHAGTSKITFQVSFFRFASNWNILVMVDQGEVMVHPGTLGEVKYCFSFMRMFTITTFFCVFIFTMLLGANSNDPIIFGIPLFIWFGGYGLNYLINVLRLQCFIKRVITKTKQP